MLWVYAAGACPDEPNNYRGVGFYRSVAPYEYLKDKFNITLDWNTLAGWKKDLTLSDEENLRDWKEVLWNRYDTIVIHHLDKPHAARTLFASRDYYSHVTGVKKRIVIDLDDNYDNVQDINKQLFYKGDFTGYEEKKEVINKAISCADAITVSTKTLYDYYRSANSNIYHCPNIAWEDYWEPVDMRANEETVNIVYQGSSTHINDLKSCIDVLVDALKENPNVKLFLMGQGYFPELNEHPQVVAIPPDRNYKTFVEAFKEYRFDIGIAPLHTGDPFNKYKSNIKFFEYGFCRIPGVFSGDPTHAYRETVTHGVNGMLARNYKDWKQSLTRLIKDVEFRHKLGGAAYEEQKKYGPDKLGPIWAKNYAKILQTTNLDARMKAIGLVKGVK
jgi:glycosyltransferase involved in cell wall biosynthesis